MSEVKELLRHVGESFPLFDANGLILSSEYFGKKAFMQPFQLGLEDLDQPLSLLIYAGVDHGHKGHVMTPFQPELGYQITQEDFSIGGRWQKTARLGMENIDFNQNPLSLEINCGNINEVSLRCPHDYSEVALRTIRNLRLQFYFPTSSFEARAWLPALASGTILFEHFYPLDLGPMPVDNRLYEGLNIFVPSDLDKLQQIAARFVLIDSESHIMR